MEKPNSKLIANLTEDEHLEEARLVAGRFCVSSPVVVKILTDIQGEFSRTAKVTLEDGSSVIVQLKDNEIDTTKVALARSLLGEIVPFTFGGKTRLTHFAYVQTYIEGTVLGEMGLSTEKESEALYQIASLISRCSLNIDCSGAVDHYIVPRLKLILCKEDIPHVGFRSKIEGLLAKVDDLKALPLALCHSDINSHNIILNDNAEVVGLIDWEHAVLLPLGCSAWCIRFLSVINIHRKDCPDERTLPLATAFWKGLWSTMPAQVTKEMEANIVTAMQIGYIISALYFGFHSPTAEALPQELERLQWMEDTFLQQQK